jgi:glutathione peroxidase-family protein
MYDSFHEMKSPILGLIHNYFGKDFRKHGDKINVLKYINRNYPPAFIMSTENDIFLPCARPMYEHLLKKNIESVYEIYGTKEQKEIGHVFHLNILSPVAGQCNDKECEFFKMHVG